MRIAIVGSRGYNNYEELTKNIDIIIEKIEKQGHKKEDIEIITGDAVGVDSLVKEYCITNGFRLKIFPAYWDDLEAEVCYIIERNNIKENALAGLFRNIEIIDYIKKDEPCLIAFWDKKGFGTKHMIFNASIEKIPLVVIEC